MRRPRSPGSVSIHAPVKGATVGGFNGVLVADVSIHAPVKGATESRKEPFTEEQFQSTRP